MKFFVQVNIKLLVSLTADSALAAEHACLDLDGVWAAHAFDLEATKTDTFRGMLLDASTVSLEELAAMSEGYKAAWKDAIHAKDEITAAADELDLIRAKYQEARAALRDAEESYNSKLKQANLAKEIIGLDLKDRH